MGNPPDHAETPLTGGYLLIVLAEPRSAEHKLAILKKLTKGLSCWNYEDSGVEIVTELNAIVNQNIEGEEGKNGEQLFQYVSDNLVAEILINPQHSTLVQCVRNLLASFTKYRCIIHAGYSYTENGSWILQDGSFSVTDFFDAYKTAEAQRTIRLHENHIRIDLHCSADAEWNQVSRVKGTRFLLNPPEKIVDNESIELTVRWLCDKIEVVELDILLEGSQVVGNIRFSRPTLYVFPAGQGDSALFGINGFNMLIDGGAGRNSCFWGFARHLDRLDAVLLTRLNNSNLEGVASFLKRKTMSSLYPQIGHFFCNFKTRKQISSSNIDAKQDVLSISLIDTAQSIITDLKQLQLRPHLCYRNINLEPINLYHKVGHGKLDMYVLNPSKDSKEVKEFLTKWNEGDQKLFNPTKDLQFPLPNIISICTLLVWQPANPNTTITRILFPGSNPQNKIFESLERVRHLEFLRHPSCSIKSMSSSTSVTVKSQTTKKTVLEKMIPGETKTVKSMENLEDSTTASNAVIQTAIIPTVPKEGTLKPKFSAETEKSKQIVKTVTKETAIAKAKIEHKYSSISAKVNSNKVIQKSTTTKKTLKLSSKSPPTDKSSPSTPIENQEKAPKPIKQIIKPKSTTTNTKSPSSTPTKSKKEEANRKVLVSSRTNSGLKRTQITKKETKPANPINTETRGISLKKNTNIVYKSSLISCDKDKSGEEEDILIVEKVAITPEKLLTPDGKKIIANELDGILTTAKDIVNKEKCVEKLSDSGATTAPTMPEDEKMTESRKESKTNESDKKIEEFKKAKDSLKTPDEVADLPFHEEADIHKPKVSEKEFETEAKTQEIVHVENAEYVLVSLDSSPEALKRQVLDTVDLMDTELDEDSDKEDEYNNEIMMKIKQSTMQSDVDEKTKLIEHLHESSKDLCEITEKIDELKKQNEHEVTNSQIHDHLQTSYHDNSKTSNVGTESHKQIKPIQIQEDEKTKLKEKKYTHEQNLNTDDNKCYTDVQKSEQIEADNAEKNETEIKQNDNPEKNLASFICDNQEKSPEPNIDTTKIVSNSILQEQGEINIEIDKQNSKSSPKAGSVCDEPLKSPVHDSITTESKTISRSSSITEVQENTCKHTSMARNQRLLVEASGSITEEQEKNTATLTDKLESKASSRAGSVCDEPLKSPIHDSITTTSSSVCDDQIKSLIHEVTTTASKVIIRSGSIALEQESTKETLNDKENVKAVGSVGDDLLKSPNSNIDTEELKTKTLFNTVSENLEFTSAVKADCNCDMNSTKYLSPNNESYEIENTTMTQAKVDFHGGEIGSSAVKDNFGSKVLKNEDSIYEEPIKIDGSEKNTNEEVISCRTNLKELRDSVPSENNCSTADNVLSDIFFNEDNSVSTSLISKNITTPQDTESFQLSDKHDVEICRRKDSFCQDKNESSTVSSCSTSSICQELNTQSSKLSSRKSSVIDESFDKPLKLQIGEKSSSLQESNIHEHNIDDNTKIFNKSGSLCDEMLNLSFKNITENVFSNKVNEQAVSSTSMTVNTESKIDNQVGSVCEGPDKSQNDEICKKENFMICTTSSIFQKTEEEKCQSPRMSTVCNETQDLQNDNKIIILPPSESNKNKSDVIERKVEESKSLGRIGSLCEEIAKFLTDDDKKISTNIISESSCSLIESIPLKSNIEELKVKTESPLQHDKNTDVLNNVTNSLQIDDKVKVNEKHDNINDINTDHSLPVKNITFSNVKSPDISTLLIEENNKTGIMNVAQMVGKNISDESFIKHTAITDNESENLKSVAPISSITSEECISKISNVLIEDIVKGSDEKNIINNSSTTEICANQPLGVILNSEDLGVTKDIVMQLKRDVHEALHQCSSDDERPFTPHSESSMSRSAMNIDDDDDDNEDNKIETDDDMAGSPMSTGPSPIQMQLDNRQMEINMDFNKAIQEHKITRGEDLTSTEANGNHVTEIKTTEHDNINQNQGTSSDTVQSWGKPLGLPPVQNINNNGFDPIREWGKPLGLPSPTQPTLELGESQNMSSKNTPKKNLKKIVDNKPVTNVMDKDAQNRIRRSESPSKLRSRSSSRMTRVNPVYLDLIYVPHHGNSKYVSADFFKRVRARNYVFSGTDPSKEVLNALIEGKQAWEDQDLEVTIIPTYDTDTLGQWVAENEELLTKLKIDLSPSASRCTIKLQDHNTSCSAYRLEF
ncbi:microtubule-associated protein futsch-like [Melanaphis sacchari]|uniref:microtubule-associated protein futsch-like n=1 Tax=Melanaphis sacchari TaxID=742174 RepID=UPI000DC12ED9|nr:microtubule-associated protein futsch-like [Melanaphis sacchari]